VINARAVQHITLILLLVILTSCIAVGVNACFDPTDEASIEVVINKPGATYDLSRLEDLRNVVVVEEGKLYIYRSHIHKDVVVVLSLQKMSYSNNAPHYLAVRVESPLAQINMTVINCGIDIVLESRSVNLRYVEKVAKELGWYVSIEDLVNNSIRGYLEKAIGNVTAKIYVFEVAEGIQLSVRTDGKSGEVVAEIDELLYRAFNLSKGVISSTGLGCFVIPAKTSLLKPAVGDEVLKEALTYELRWLSKISVIKGLTEDDILSLASKAVPGLAGWNERLVYWRGSWYPYAELVSKGLIEGGYLIKGAGGCSWDYPLEKISEDPPELTEQLAKPLTDGAMLIGTAVAVALAVAIAVVLVNTIKSAATRIV